jgi:hypothetical protein
MKMTNRIKLLVAISVVCLSGCASKLKDYAWYPSFDSGVKFEQALAKCEYHLQLMGKGNDRMAGAIIGMQSPVFEKCMNQYGFKWQKNPT